MDVGAVSCRYVGDSEQLIKAHVARRYVVGPRSRGPARHDIGQKAFYLVSKLLNFALDTASLRT